MLQYENGEGCVMSCVLSSIELASVTNAAGRRNHAEGKQSFRRRGQVGEA